jgi:large subunit ribosomal protein L4
VLDSASVNAVKTNALAKRLNKLGVADMLIVDGEFDKNFAMSARNLANVALVPASGLNVYDIIKHDTLVMTKAAVSAIEERLS